MRKLLELAPNDLSARWLLNVAAMTVGEYPKGVEQKYRIDSEKLASGATAPRFTNRAHDLGVDAFGLSGGMIVDDFNGDHLLDIVAPDCHPGFRGPTLSGG